jgi:hypothetical protein
VWGQSWRTSAAPRFLLRALLVLAFLFVCRWGIVYYDRAPWDRAAGPISIEALRGFGMDALAVAIVTGLALVVAKASVRTATVLFAAAAGYLLLMGAANVRVASVYRQPATINLIEYGDFLDLGRARSLTEYMTVVVEILLVAAAVCWLALAGAGRLQRSQLFEWRAARWAVVAASLLALVAMPLYGLAHDDEQTRRRHANAGWWLIKSIVAPPVPKVAEIADPDLRDPFETYATGAANRITTPERVARAGIRNVLVIVLESVGSEYLDLRRAPELTPTLARLRSQAAYFPNTFAPIPNSTMSLFTLMSGMYSPVTSQSIPIDEPDYPAPTLLEIFGSAGKRSAIFTSSWDFMDFGKYLGGRGAERIVQMHDDCRGETGPATARWGRADDCNVAALKQWVGQSDRDFFALLWTRRTHYPYGIDASELAANRELARPAYLAQIASSDRLIGELVGWLDRRGKLDDTLVVVLGDHGQAFFQHSNQAHGNDVYRETVLVPAMFINRRLFSGTTDPSPIRLIDVPSTILALTGEAAPATFQGLDLSTLQRPRRPFFAAVWANRVMGFQDGPMKYNYSNETGKLEIFDIARDPHETVDLGLDASAAERAAIARRIMNWKATVAAKIAAGRGAERPR